jgi:hypothetical protein
MHQLSSTGLKSRHLVAKSVESCLPEGLPYNWDEKLRKLVEGICLSRSLLLQSIAQTRAGSVRTTENSLSAFLSHDRLEVSRAQRACVVSVLKRLSRRRIYRHHGKAVLVIDSTDHAKTRSRRKKRPLPGKGQVRLHNLPTRETILVPGYQEIWIGILLADRTVLPITRRLWSENGPDCASRSLAELSEIRRAVEVVRETFKLDAILVADSGFRSKDLLHWIKKVEKLDFVIRLQGKLTVRAGRSKGLLEELVAWWPQRLRMPWRDGTKRMLVSDVSSRRVSVQTETKENLSFNVVCLTATKAGIAPMFLATTLTTETIHDLMMIVKLYSWRWGIETFFWKFKEALNARSWRVFSSWEAIDRLLAAAHMAYLILVLMAEFAQRGRTPEMRKLWQRMEELLRRRFARPPAMTHGRFFQLIAMDFQTP